VTVRTEARQKSPPIHESNSVISGGRGTTPGSEKGGRERKGENIKPKRKSWKRREYWSIGLQIAKKGKTKKAQFTHELEKREGKKGGTS